MARVTTRRFFPFCTPPAELWDGTTFFSGNPSNDNTKQTNVVGPGTLYPVGFQLTEMVKIYNRIRSYSFTESFTIKTWVWDEGDEQWNDFAPTVFNLSITGSSYEPAENDDGILFDVGFQPSGSSVVLDEWSAANESKLACPTGRVATIFSPFDVYDIETQFCLFNDTLSNPNMLFYDEKFFPRFYLKINFLPFEDVFTFSTYLPHVTKPTAQNVVGFHTFQFFGENVNFYGLDAPSGNPGGSSFERPELVSINLEMDAAQFAQYKDDDGNPFYDEDTGAQL
jgi:hypothetical protein